MICPRCGTEDHGGVTFCQHCGMRLPLSVEPAAAGQSDQGHTIGDIGFVKGGIKQGKVNVGDGSTVVFHEAAKVPSPRCARCQKELNGAPTEEGLCWECHNNILQARREEAAEEARRAAQANIDLAIEYYRKFNKFEEAVALLKQARQQCTELATEINTFIIEAERAAEDYRKLQTEENREKRIRQHLATGEVAFRSRDYETAIAAARLALQENADNPQVERLLNLALERKKEEEKLPRAKSAEQPGPQKPAENEAPITSRAETGSVGAASGSEGGTGTATPPFGKESRPEPGNVKAQTTSLDQQQRQKRIKMFLIATIAGVVIICVVGFLVMKPSQHQPASTASGPANTASAPTTVSSTSENPSRKAASTSTRVEDQSGTSRKMDRAVTASPVLQTESLQTSSLPFEVEVNIFGQRRAGQNDYREVPVKNGATLKSGDELQVYVRPNRDCYIYVLIFDSKGSAGVLFPSQAAGTKNSVKGGVSRQIPGGNKWFFLDENTGVETIYVLASLTPMTDIGGLLANMERKGRRQRQDDSQKILSQVRTRGIAVVKAGPIREYKTSDGDVIRNVTDVVEGKGSLTWTVCFNHI